MSFDMRVLKILVIVMVFNHVAESRPLPTSSIAGDEEIEVEINTFSKTWDPLNKEGNMTCVIMHLLGVHSFGVQFVSDHLRQWPTRNALIREDVYDATLHTIADELCGFWKSSKRNASLRMYQGRLNKKVASIPQAELRECVRLDIEVKMKPFHKLYCA